MRCKSIVFLTVVLLTAGFASAVVWNPVANPDPNAIVNGATNWNIAANWTTSTLPDVQGTATFNVANQAECQITGSQTCSKFVKGDGSVAIPDHIVRIMNGGTLTNEGNGWAAIGYNNDGGSVIVEEGGVWNCNAHLWIPTVAGGVGRLVVDGGTVLVRDAMDLGRNATVGYVTLNSGLLQARYLDDAADGVGSLWDIRFGRFVLTGGEQDDYDRIQSRIANGTMVAFGGLGTVKVEKIDGNWTVTGVHPLNPTPADGAVVVLNGVDNDVPLSWTNLDPNAPGDDVYVDVWFGTDPNKLAGDAFYKKIVVAGQNVESAIAQNLDAETYYWQVDSYIYGAGHINDANMIEGPVFYFDAVSDGAPSIVIDTPDTLTWAGEPVTLTATVTDDLQSASSVVWSSPVDANIIYTNESYAYPTATVTVAGDSHLPWTVFTATVSDGNPLLLTGSDTVRIDIGENACQAAGGGFMHLFNVYTADFDRNCIVNLLDFAVVAEQWLTDYNLPGPIPIP